VPEGHLVHRYADEQRAVLAGRVVRASSPQGRFDAAPYDRARLVEVEALGKHLIYAFDGLDPIHVHLGLRGLFLRYDDPAAPVRGATRLLLRGPDGVAFGLVAPMTCETLPAAREAALRSSLGPDPLAPAAAADESRDAVADDAVRRLTAARDPVGAAILDQAVWAGIGNAWRAELLFCAGIDPGRRVGADEARTLWDLTVRLLALGRDVGQVVSDPAHPDERWVYKRETCRACGAPVRTWQLAGRTAYACPVQQT
jgi:endonuclease-8